MQYFQKILAEPAGIGAQNEHRLVYAEGIYEESRALKLVAKHVIDQEAAIAFFDNPRRLQEDILSDGAELVLEKLDYKIFN